jgi:hypothetical protein
LQLADRIEAFGVEAVLGRRLTVGEMNRIKAAQNVYHARKSRDAAENWAKWAEDNPRLSEILIHVERIRDG